MKTTDETTEYQVLENQLAALEKEYAQLEKENSELQSRIARMEEQLLLAASKRFGKSSEKTDPNQLSLFNEAETTQDKDEPEPTLETITYERKKATRERQLKLDDLPTERIVYELDEAECTCSACQNPLHEMGSDIRQELHIIPMQFKVVEHERKKYSCRHCEKHADSVPIVTAPIPEPLIKKSAASPSLVSYIINEKFVKAVPLYRQEQEFARHGLAISRQNMSSWIIRTTTDYLSLVYETLKASLSEEAVLHADETVVQVLQEPGRKADTNSYMWVYTTSRESKHPAALYEYQPTRSSSAPKAFLANFSGYLHTDGYSGYDALVKVKPDITLVGCWAHARRKFDEACRAIKDEAQRKTSQATVGLDFCNRLFALERGYQEQKLTPEQICVQRQLQSVPVAEALLAWAKTHQCTVRSLFKDAITYLLNQWDKLMAVFADGGLELSNNRGERAIKPFVIGRKNWLFANTQKGARSSAICYSLVESAKLNNLNPMSYLRYLLERLPNMGDTQLSELMPWNPHVQAECRV